MRNLQVLNTAGLESITRAARVRAEARRRRSSTALTPQQMARFLDWLRDPGFEIDPLARSEDPLRARCTGRRGTSEGRSRSRGDSGVTAAAGDQ